MYLPDIPVSVAFGGLIVASNLARREAAVDERQVARRSLRQVLAYGVLFHCPDSFFAFVWYPDWNLGYFVPWERVGFGVAVLLELGLLGLLLLGWKLALLAARGSSRRVWIPIVASFVGAGVALAAVRDRYQHIGTYAQFHAGQAPLGETSAGFTMFTALAGCYLIVPLLALLAANVLDRGSTER